MVPDRRAPLEAFAPGSIQFHYEKRWERKKLKQEVKVVFYSPNKTLNGINSDGRAPPGAYP